MWFLLSMSFHTRKPQGIPDHMLPVSLAENRSANHTSYSSLSPGVARGNTGSREGKRKRVWQRGAQEAKMLRGSSYGHQGVCTLNTSMCTIQENILRRKAAVVSNVRLFWPESRPLEKREEKGKTRLSTRAKQCWCRHSKNRSKHLQPVGGGGGGEPAIR